MRRIIVTSIIALLCAAGVAQSQTQAQTQVQVQVQAQPGAGAAEVVAGRRAAFALSLVAFGGLNASSEAPGSEAPGADRRQLQLGATALARWARALPGLFPAGTSSTDLPGQTAASPAIWTNRADFEAKAAAYAAAADRLSELSGDLEAYKTQLGVVNDTCRSCHSVYRVRPG